MPCCAELCLEFGDKHFCLLRTQLRPPNSFPIGGEFESSQEPKDKSCRIVAIGSFRLYCFGFCVSRTAGTDQIFVEGRTRRSWGLMAAVNVDLSQMETAEAFGLYDSERSSFSPKSSQCHMLRGKIKSCVCATELGERAEYSLCFAVLLSLAPASGLLQNANFVQYLKGKQKATGRSNLSMKYSVSSGIPGLIAHPCDTEVLQPPPGDLNPCAVDRIPELLYVKNYVTFRTGFGVFCPPVQNCFSAGPENQVNNKIQIKDLFLPQDWCLQIAAYQVTSATALLCHAADSTRCGIEGLEQPLESQLILRGIMFIPSWCLAMSVNSFPSYAGKGMIPSFSLKSLYLNPICALIAGYHGGCGQWCLGHAVSRIKHRVEEIKDADPGTKSTALSDEQREFQCRRRGEQKRQRGEARLCFG
ncbi:hypothetical protein Q9966_006571 [Columba livia]|nr:hypothetical protein Q9966_006571 [Columba livia]